MKADHVRGTCQRTHDLGSRSSCSFVNDIERSRARLGRQRPPSAKRGSAARPAWPPHHHQGHRRSLPLTSDPAKWPAFTDTAGWAEVVSTGTISACPPGLAVGVLRAKAICGDQRTVNALMTYVSDSILRQLRRMIGMHHPNCGRDIIERAAGALMEAILDPLSTDGDDLVVAFTSRVRFRGIDAARAENLYRTRHLPLITDGDGEPLGSDDRRTGDGRSSVEVEHVLALLADPRMRLAFRLYLEGMQIYRGDPCIASVLGCHPKTAARLISQARRLLAAEVGT